MIECFDDDLSEDGLFVHLVGGDGVVGDLTVKPSSSDVDASACNVDNSNNLGVSALVTERLGNLLLN
jgi:hypothetical protein